MRSRWERSLRAAALAIGVVLVATWLAAQIGKILEAHTAADATKFDQLESNLVTVTLMLLPILSLALGLRLLERIHRIRLKLFVTFGIGQVVAFIAAIVAANNSRAMPFAAPNDGFFAVLLVYATVLSLALAYLLASSMTASLAHIRAGAAGIADGNLETRITLDTYDELADLANDLNWMATRLGAVAYREHRQEQARRELVAAVSHDLRTPLAALQATIEAIIDGVVTDEMTVRRYLGTMHTCTLELSCLIDDLFELSRIDAGALSLDLAPTSVADLVMATVKQMQPQATARDVALCAAVEPSLPLVPLDARHIGRVLSNLVDNAVRHTPLHGRVHILARRKDLLVLVSVVDTGVGIAPEDLPHVFERFYRGEKSRSREHGGAGLGLAISKGIVEAHGGTIWAEAHQPRGACITFTLPVEWTEREGSTPSLSTSNGRVRAQSYDAS